MAKITITGDVAADKLADALAQQLLIAVRELGGSRAGEYNVTVTLNADGSYHWHWDWRWAPSKLGGSAGKGLANGRG